MVNKRGQLNTNVIIALILGVLVLVFLIYGFTNGWNKVLPWLNTDNSETLQTQCLAACTTNNEYSFCTMERTLKASDLPNGKSEVAVTCNFLATHSSYTKYGVDACAGLCPVLESGVYASLVEAKAACLEEGAMTKYMEAEEVVEYTCTNDDVD